MKIHVRRRHIRHGCPRDYWNCPIALAYADQTGERKLVDIASIGAKGLPRSARRFIARFDAGLPVKPFAFVLK